MNTPYDYKRFAILYVDDEEKSLKYFTKTFGDTFRVFTAPNAVEGYRLLVDHQDEIGVVMSDQRMPGEQGVQFLERSRRLQPRIIRILATAFADLDAAICAVNTGAIYKYITKPWEVANLEVTLKRGLEFFMLQIERDLLLREKLVSLHRILIADRVLSLGVLAAGLGHRMRNTIEAVQRFLDLAPDMLRGEQVNLDQLRNPNFWQDFHRHVQEQVKTAFRLLEDLSEETKRPFRFDAEVRLRAVIDAAVRELAEPLAQQRIVVANDVPADLPPLRVDGVRFAKLFGLLLRDEMLNLQDGAVITFGATVRPVSPDQPSEVEIGIHDNGPGLPHAAILSVLDPLVERTGKAQDFGIYLMACYFIVYHHGGRINLDPRQGAGLNLRITLPLEPPTASLQIESEEFLLRAMTNERLWDRLLAGE
jgi:two-component system probable response regulator PhcQ